MTLNEQQTRRVERGLALLALGMHHSTTAREQASGQPLTTYQVCAMDQTAWPCDYAQWAMERIQTAPPPAPPAPPGAANDGFAPRFQFGNGHSTGPDHPHLHRSAPSTPRTPRPT